ncbi:hypothetical protein CMU89_01540 [Elizabethkingia anophelis]|uniref:hypothetical protein n=1 Tax=Elizabethkingia anophelis TaxID=1117645 RepID=UPI000531BDC2|nr:hypothetical protein [Elizabethkingia anophelis]KGT10078.1 hypothetical protein NV63_02775 [Elizabethkingia anophelis]MBG0503693.1 hypothetical protein [Elizabethkingia anophelis]MCT3922048.1 hypothetical protein [Elizabethkingia anophelis]MCT3957861.1 hypothetical protein [Elizabethkingia anophelis]MCT4060985.1 hypothetical protein [Elizabethkingia anophelis]
MKNIAYIELDTHAELAINFIELTRDSQYLHVEYFFSRKILDRINEKGSHVIHAEAATLLKELDGRKFDAVIIGTAHRYFNVFEEVARNYPTFIIAHNLNFIKASKADIFRNIFKQDRSFRIKLWLKEGLMKKDKLYSEARSLFILDENIDELQYPYELRWLPLLYTKHSEQKIQTNLVAIPGTVDQHRRNYKRIFNKIKYFRGNFTFSFLGRAEGKELDKLQRVSQNLPDHINIEYYDSRVSHEEFERKMQAAEVLWCPIQKETRFFGITEIYGKTKMSGNIGDAIKYAKPAIFPKSYSASYSFIFKEKRDIEKQITEIKNKHYDFDSFEISLVRRKLEYLLSNL